jgi:hypothetical protein
MRMDGIMPVMSSSAVRHSKHANLRLWRGFPGDIRRPRTEPPYPVRRCGHTCQRPSIGISIARAAKTALAAAYPSGPGARMCGRKCLSYKLEQTNKPSAAMLGIVTCQSARALSTIAVPAAPDAHRTPLRSERSEFSSPKQCHGIFRRVGLTT